MAEREASDDPEARARAAAAYLDMWEAIVSEHARRGPAAPEQGGAAHDE